MATHEVPTSTTPAPKKRYLPTRLEFVIALKTHIPYRKNEMYYVQSTNLDGSLVTYDVCGLKRNLTGNGMFGGGPFEDEDILMFATATPEVETVGRARYKKVDGSDVAKISRIVNPDNGFRFDMPTRRFTYQLQKP